MESMEYSGKTVEEALTGALVQLGLTSDQIEYEVVEKGSSGFLGVGSKDAVIRVTRKYTIEDTAADFLSAVLPLMGADVSLDISVDEEENVMEINMEGSNTGVLIGKRGQTLDALQYLTSLVVNKQTDSYMRLKLDTENYRERRKETLENLARNVASKAKRTGREVALEPMNPYERRIIHSALQDDPYVTTYSEGENLNRHVIVAPQGTPPERSQRRSYGRNRY